MLHLVAFVVIGLALSWLVSWVSECRSTVLVVACGLVGAVAAGEAFQSLFGTSATPYGSLFMAMLFASVIAWLPTDHCLRRDAMEYTEPLGHRSPSGQD